MTSFVLIRWRRYLRLGYYQFVYLHYLPDTLLGTSVDSTVPSSSNTSSNKASKKSSSFKAASSATTASTSPVQVKSQATAASKSNGVPSYMKATSNSSRKISER